MLLPLPLPIPPPPPILPLGDDGGDDGDDDDDDGGGGGGGGEEEEGEEEACEVCSPFVAWESSLCPVGVGVGREDQPGVE